MRHLICSYKFQWLALSTLALAVVCILFMSSPSDVMALSFSVNQGHVDMSASDDYLDHDVVKALVYLDDDELAEFLMEQDHLDSNIVFTINNSSVNYHEIEIACAPIVMSVGSFMLGYLGTRILDKFLDKEPDPLPPKSTTYEISPRDDLIRVESFYNAETGRCEMRGLFNEAGGLVH